jgi:hypothetical protein
MSTERETAIEYLRVAMAALERGDDREGLYHIDKAQSLLLRPSAETEPTGALRGESFRFAHLGKVLAAKAEKAITSQIVE